MATLPKATTSVSDTAGALAGGLDLICLIAPVATNADTTPRVYGSAADVYTQHGYGGVVEYAARHIQRTGKAVMVIGIPIATVGTVGRKNAAGNSGTSVVTVTAGGTGVLGEHDGVVKVVRGGTVGTDQITLSLSLDGGRTYQPVRLGTAVSYAVPYVNTTLAFAAGTLVAGETVLQWSGTAPRSDATGWAAARVALATQQKAFRTALLIGDLQNSTEANAFLDQINAYETSNERFTRGRASVIDRLPLAALSHEIVRMTGSPTITFLEVGATGDTITRSAGSFITDGFAVGDIITVAGAVLTSGYNNVTGPIASLTATVITLNTTDLINEGPISGVTISGTPGLTFAEVGASGDTITRSRGSWLTDGFRVADLITVSGTASNNITAAQGLAAVTDTVLTLGTDDLAAEVIGSYSVTLTAGQTIPVWAAATEAAFATVNGFRLDLSMGRGRFTSPFSGWYFRRPAAWGASIREYQHDLQIATWRKADGPSAEADLFDASGALVEYDDRVHGAAASLARFTSYRTWANGPTGGFVSQSLTRGEEASLLSQSHNVDVVNFACTTTQLNTELAVGESLVLNDDGTATTDALSTIQKRVNDALELALLVNAKGEGQRASKAVWTPSADDILNVPDATMNGFLDLNFLGTIHSVITKVRIRTAGQ